MADSVRVPVRIVAGERWGHLSLLAETHLICGEAVNQKNDRLSFAGGHRVKLYSFKKNVHWKIPEDIPLDITNVAPAAVPRRKQR
jgi:hypothetical protein